MLAHSLSFLLGYLAVGLLACFLARRGWPEDWDETLLASVLGPPLVAMLAAGAAACFVWTRLQAEWGSTRQASAG